MTDRNDPRAAFIAASLWHGPLDEARAILASHPEVATSDIHTAAILGDDAAVRRFLEADPASATAKGGPGALDALTHLCFSRYLRLEPARSEGFMRAATALLDAGANANTGFFDANHTPQPVWESALYGAAGVAHHAGVTRLLVEHGADPNDGEVPYHAAETDDNGALVALVEGGKLSPDSLATLLLRKADWHEYEGMKYLLEHGADPNRMTHWRLTPLHQALRRDNAIEHIALLLEHGADPLLKSRAVGMTGVEIAARRGRANALELFERRGFPIELSGVAELLAACARNATATVRAIATRDPAPVRELVADGGQPLAEFAGVGNTDGVRQLLDLGVPAAARFKTGDGYWDVAEDSTALHVAAWRMRAEIVKLLLERGAPPDALDGKGRTPLALAVRACVDSYWMERRSPDSVRALLDAGASADGVPFPSGYAEVDELLRSYRK